MKVSIPDSYLNFPGIKEIMNHPEFDLMKTFRHHGRISCFEHTLKVTERAFWMTEKSGADIITTIRGALLHDFYLYDWHGGGPSWHGYRHPFRAFREASARFELNRIEKDIIIKHMFPLTPFPPLYRESWIVCIADKASAFEDYSGVMTEYLKMRLVGEAAAD